MTDPIAFTALPLPDQAHILLLHRPGLVWMYEPPEAHDPEPDPLRVVAIANLALWQQWLTRAPEVAARMREVCDVPEEEQG